jgi:hypothetical protein
MFLNQQKSRFTLNALSVCAAALFIIFSSYRSFASVAISVERQAGIYSLVKLTDDVTLSNSPVTVPSPAVTANKGNSSRVSFASKFILQVPHLLVGDHSSFFQTLNSVLNARPVRLHLVLRVMRI